MLSLQTSRGIDSSPGAKDAATPAQPTPGSELPPLPFTASQWHSSPMAFKRWLDSPAPIVVVGLLWPIAGFTVGAGVVSLLTGNPVLGFFVGAFLGFAGLVVGIIKAAPNEGEPPDVQP